MRLRSVKFKNGRAPVHVLYNAEKEPERDNVQGGVERGARLLSEMSNEQSKLDGYIVIGMYSDGTTSLGYRVPERIPRCLLVGYISEIVRRDIVTGAEAEAVFDSKFQWVE